MSSAILATAISLALILSTTPPADYDARLDDDTDTAGVGATADAWKQGADGRTPAHDGPQDKYLRADARSCITFGDLEAIESITTAPGVCPEGTENFEITPACDGIRLDALWVQRVQDDGSYADPEQLSGNECVTPQDLATQARREFRSMTITPPKATVQGNLPMVVNVHYPAYTTATVQDREVSLLDVPVVIRAEPVEYTWDFDDPHSAAGATLTTTDPGRPWHDGDPVPDESWVGHTYSRLGTPGKDAGTAVDDKGNVYRTGVTVALTTTWQGRFRLQGTSTWTDIPGTITTTTTNDAATVTEARTRLVCDDLGSSSTC